MRYGTSMWLGALVLGGACVAAAACSSSNAPPPAPADAGAGAGALACGATASTTVMTPFAAPNSQLTFTTPNIPCNMFSITKYGAKSDGTTKNTDAFKQAVAAASVAGGVVDVPAGNWLTGPIQLASNVELHVEAGATITFSPDFADYGPPLVPTRWEGLDIMNWSPLVYCLNCTNVAITGTGTLFGNGAYWWDWKTPSKAEDQRMYKLILANIQANGVTFVNGVPMLPGSSTDAGSSDEGGASVDGGAPSEAGSNPAPTTGALCGTLTPPSSGVLKGLRPTMVEFNGCTNVLIQGVTIQDGPYWIMHPLYSENVIVRGVHVLSGKQTALPTGGPAANGDGIDIDSCKKILVEDTDFDTSDDNIAIKSGLNEDGICVNRPSEEVVLRRITSISGHGGLTIGSEMSGGVTNVFGTDATLTGAGVQYPLRFKTLPGRGGTISNIFYDTITMGNWTMGGIIIDMAYNSSTVPPSDTTLLPAIKHVSFKNLSGPMNMTGMGSCAAGALCPPMSFTGIVKSPLQDISLTNVSLTGTDSTCISGPNGVTLTNVNVPGVPMNGTWNCQ